MLCLSLGCKGKDAEEGGAPNKNRIVGYLYGRNFTPDDLQYIMEGKLTHLNIAFVNPWDASGTLSYPAQLQQAVKAANERNIAVFLSLGGAAATTQWKTLLMPASRTSFIAKLVKLCKDLNANGLDVDLEGAYIDANYEGFVTELGTALHKENKEITAALATWNGDSVSDKALATFDFVNIMSYDKTGPWRPQEPGPHSPVSMAEDDLNYWIDKRSVPPEKITLGVPFYGYGFGADIKSEWFYNELVNDFPQAPNVDEIELPGKGTIYYNGKSTIAKKVDLVKKRNVSGIMIWELKHDAKGEHSLLTLINNKLIN